MKYLLCLLILVCAPASGDDQQPDATIVVPRALIASMLEHNRQLRNALVDADQALHDERHQHAIDNEKLGCV